VSGGRQQQEHAVDEDANVHLSLLAEQLAALWTNIWSRHTVAVELDYISHSHRPAHQQQQQGADLLRQIKAGLDRLASALVGVQLTEGVQQNNSKTAVWSFDGLENNY
jgi:hypothetical protein